MKDDTADVVANFMCYVFLIAVLVVGFAWHQFDKRHDFDCTPRHYVNQVWTNDNGDIVGHAITEDSVIKPVERCQ